MIAALLGSGAVLALLVTLGAPATHSVVPNTVWPGQFSALLQVGLPYPRWLPEAFSGLGSPTFIFYAPLPFYLLAAVDILTGGWLRPSHLVGVGCAVMLAASGITMRFWLLRRAGKRAALLGGVAYACAPYHLYDVFVRGSLGELAAYAILPLLLVALEAALNRRPGGVAGLALSAGALLLSHLPSALFIGGLLVPARMIWFAAQHKQGPRAAAVPLLRAVVGGALGLGLAAVYVLPALDLRVIARMDYFAGGYYDARRWLLLWPSGWGSSMEYGFVLSLTVSLVAIALLALHVDWRAGKRGEGAFWSLVILAVALLMSGLLPWIWEPSSPLSNIEFPWRMLLMAEFAAICVLVDGMPRWRGMQRRLAIGIPAFLAAPALGILMGAASYGYRLVLTDANWRWMESEVARVKPDAIEYLPAGHPLVFGQRSVPRWDEVLSLVAIGADRGGAWLDPPHGRVVIGPSGPRGEAAIEVEAATPVTVVLRRFAYPLWRLEAEDGSVSPILTPHGADRLLSFEVPAGMSRWRLVWSPPASLRVGVWISAVAAVGVLVLVVLAAVRRTQPTGRVPTHGT